MGEMASDDQGVGWAALGTGDVPEILFQAQQSWSLNAAAALCLHLRKEFPFGKSGGGCERTGDRGFSGLWNASGRH